jgi:hypothetical protein
MELIQMTNENSQTVDVPSVEHAALGHMPESTFAEPINDQLKDHQIASDDWDKSKLVKELYLWAERFIFEFKLKTNMPALRIDLIKKSLYGHYRRGRNGFGLRNEIAINETYLEELKGWEILGVLFHELLHAEEERTGKPGKNNYHKQPFRNRAESFGLIVDTSGYTQYKPAPSPFFDILNKYGVNIPDIPQPAIPQNIPSKAKLKLWICECWPKPVRVRVAISDFRAKCLRCNQNFQPVERS